MLSRLARLVEWDEKKKNRWKFREIVRQNSKHSRIKNNTKTLRSFCLFLQINIPCVEINNNLNIRPAKPWLEKELKSSNFALFNDIFFCWLNKNTDCELLFASFRDFYTLWTVHILKFKNE